MERRTSRAPHPPLHWRWCSVSVGWRAAATPPFFLLRSSTVVACSCQSHGDRLLLSMARSRHPRRRWAAPVTGCPVATTAKATLHKRKVTQGATWLVVEEGGEEGVWGTFDYSKIQLSIGKRKKEEKKQPWRVRNGTCPQRTILGPKWSKSTTETSLFHPSILVNFRAVSGRRKKRRETQKKIKKTFLKKKKFLRTYFLKRKINTEKKQ